MNTLVVGTRGSQLALCQTRQMVDRLIELNPGITCRVQIIKTMGDRITDVPLASIGDKGLFVKEIEAALLSGEVDFAVHSAKDMPSEMVDDLCVAAFPEREDPSDALISKDGKFAELPPGSSIGTSSVRRRAQLLRARPDLKVADLRGNLDTRLRKLEERQYDAIVLACAGLRRMGWESCITQLLPFDVCLPAAGQGAIAIQCRSDSPALGFLKKLDHRATRDCVTAERALLAAMDAGCQTPVAALARVVGDRIEIEAVVASLDGNRIVRMSDAGDAADPASVGRRLAAGLLDSPAAELLEEARRDVGPKGMGAA